MATLTKGKTFVNGELVTPEKLHQLVDAATLSPLVNADIASNAAIADTKLATISTANKVAQSAVANLTTDLAGKAASSHTHTIANVTGLQTALDGKQASGSYAPATGIAATAITGTAVITTDSRLSDARTPTTHTHAAADITSGTLANARTTATSANTANAIVARDASGNFSAGTITANLTGTASGNAPSTGIAPSAITGTAVITTDSRLSDARTPTSHTHGNLTNAGAIGATANLPVVTTTSGVLTTIPAGSAGQVLTSNGGTSAPSFQTLAATSTNANNLTGGSAGTVPYQSAAGTTAMLAAGTSGQVLRSNGAAAPSWLTLATSATTDTTNAGNITSGTLAIARIPTGATATTVCIGNDTRLSNERTPIDSSVSFSKLVEAVQNTLVPTGSVVAFAFNASAGIPEGWLECNGFAISRSTYSNLYSKIGVSYGSGDGSTTFNLPDLRGYFVRGSGTNSDGTASGTFGAKQNDDVKPHNHPASISTGNCVLSVQEIQGGRSTGSATTITDINVSTGFPSVSIAIQTNLGTETRPKNIAMMYCIKT